MSAHPKRVQVVIAGAGPVGCVAATYLAQQGIDVMLAETGPDAAQDLRASTFHPPTLEMLDTLGITDYLMEAGLNAPVYCWRDRKTGEVLSFDLSEISDVTRFPFRIQCEQYYLARKLAERLQELPNAQVMYGHRAIHFEQDDDGVTVSLEHMTGISQIRTDQIIGTDLADAGHMFEQDDDGVTVSLEHMTGISQIRADYLIGADGANSLVRKWMNIEFDGFTYPEHFLCLSTKQPIHDEIPNLSHVNYVSDPDEWLVLLRVPSVWRVLVPAGLDEDPAWLTSDAKKDQVFGGLLADGEAVQTEHRTLYRVHQRVAKSFHDNRVLLMGDSAHLNNPLGGFGMNSGIHDAFNGCEKLVKILRGEASPDLLQLYDRQRRTVTHAFTQQQTIENMAIMRGGQSAAHQRRQDAMQALANDPDRRRAYLLKQAMFTSLADAAAIA